MPPRPERMRTAGVSAATWASRPERWTTRSSPWGWTSITIWIGTSPSGRWCRSVRWAISFRFPSQAWAGITSVSRTESTSCPLRESDWPTRTSTGEQARPSSTGMTRAGSFRSACRWNIRSFTIWRSPRPCKWTCTTSIFLRPFRKKTARVWRCSSGFAGGRNSWCSRSPAWSFRRSRPQRGSGLSWRAESPEGSISSEWSMLQVNRTDEPVLDAGQERHVIAGTASSVKKSSWPCFYHPGNRRNQVQWCGGKDSFHSFLASLLILVFQLRPFDSAARYSLTTKCTLLFFCRQSLLCWKQSGRSFP